MAELLLGPAEDDFRALPFRELRPRFSKEPRVGDGQRAVVGERLRHFPVRIVEGG